MYLLRFNESKKNTGGSMRKITILLIVVMATALFAGEYPKVDIHGRFLLEMDYENNLADWTDFKDNANNDKTTYTQGRLDLSFNTHINENIMVKIHSRLESDDEASSKWIKFNMDSDQKIKDTRLKLQEAYVQYDNLFFEGLSAHLGQRLWNYGGGNIFGPADYISGAALMFKRDNLWVDLQTANLAEYEDAEYTNIEEDHAAKIFGLIGGMNKIADMADVQAYFFRKGENVESFDDNGLSKNETECNAFNVFGARGDVTLMDGMLKPYLEFAMQTGANDATGIDYSGMLLDVGLNAEFDLGFGTLMPRAELFMRSGDDAGSDDENEAFTGVGMGLVEHGYQAVNIFWKLTDNGFKADVDHGMMMVNFGTDFTPEMCKKMNVGFNFWMFNDNSTDVKIGTKEVSGENMWNEFNLYGSYKVHKNAKFYAGLGMLMPNKDYGFNYTDDNDVSHLFMFGEDTATVMWFGTEVKW